MYCNAAMPPAYIHLLTSYMRLGPWEFSQDNFEESSGLQSRRNPNIGAHEVDEPFRLKLQHRLVLELLVDFSRI